MTTPLVLLVLLGFTSICARRWTEDDEDRRIQEIKDREMKLYEEEMRSQDLGRTIFKGASRAVSMPLRGFPDDRESKERQESAESPAQTSQFWCYHCASPINKVDVDLRKSIKNLFEIRRTEFPKDAVTTECLSAKNFTMLKKQYCNYRYCQTLSVVDHNAGASFVVRGCAENFGAINKKVMEKHQTCIRLHDKLDIHECICKEESYCKAGRRQRSSFAATNLVFATLVFVVFLLF